MFIVKFNHSLQLVFMESLQVFMEMGMCKILNKNVYICSYSICWVIVKPSHMSYACVYIMFHVDFNLCLKSVHIFFKVYRHFWKCVFLKKCMGGCKLMMVSHDGLVAIQTWKTNNLLIWRDYLRYFYNEFEYGVKRWNVGNCINFPNIQLYL